MTGEWHNFFFAVICATGSLLGLLFVAISINISRIAASPNLSKAAMQPLLLLLSLLVVSIYFLIPQQSLLALGLEVLITGVVIGVIMSFNDMSVYKKADKTKRDRYISNFVFNSLPYTLIIATGATILISGKSGIYIMVPAIVISFVQTSIISWALLVEINLHKSNQRWNKNSNDAA